MADIVKVMTEIEISELNKNESIIKKGLKTFSEVGSALLVIRDGKLYREQFKTFEDYCGERWGIARAQAYRMIEGAKVVSNLSPIGDIPQTESQARPLAKLPASQQAEVWESVAEKAKREERKVTAKDVEMAVSEAIDPMGSGKQPIAKETYSSETIAGLKRYWKLANKKERKEFLGWIKKV